MKISCKPQVGRSTAFETMCYGTFIQYLRQNPFHIKQYNVIILKLYHRSAKKTIMSSANYTCPGLILNEENNLHVHTQMRQTITKSELENMQCQNKEKLFLRFAS